MAVPASMRVLSPAWIPLPATQVRTRLGGGASLSGCKMLAAETYSGLPLPAAFAALAGIAASSCL